MGEVEPVRSPLDPRLRTREGFPVSLSDFDRPAGFASSPADRARCAEVLNRHLVASMALRSQAKHARWNVRGTGFPQARRYFGQLAREVDHWSEALAERTGVIGHCAHGAAVDSYLPAYGLRLAACEPHAEELGRSVARFANGIKLAVDAADELGDPVTVHVLLGIARRAERARWQLEAHHVPILEGATPLA